MPDLGSFNAIDGLQSGDGPEINRDPPPKLNNIPDIESEIDLLKLRKGAQFYARFINNPKGGSDNLRWANDHIAQLRKGTMSRHGISKDYWINGTFLERPPLAEYLGGGKFKVLE